MDNNYIRCWNSWGLFAIQVFQKGMEPYLALTKQIINLLKFLIKTFDKDPSALSSYEIFINILEKSFYVVEDIVNNQDIIAGMPLEGQISYIRAKIEAKIDEYLTEQDIVLSEDDQNAIDTVMNIMDFFLKLLLPKLSPEIKP